MEGEIQEVKQARRERGAGRVWQIGRRWWIQYYTRGRQVRESSKSQAKGVADRLLKRRLYEVAAGQLPMPRIDSVRYADIREAFYADYRINHRKSLIKIETENGSGAEVVWGVQHLDSFFRDYRAVDITTDKIREFINKRQGVGASSASINRALAGLRRMFHLAVQDGKLRDVPHIPMLKEPPARKGFLEYDQYVKLRDASSPELKPLLTTGYFTGMRLGELLPLRREQVHLLDRNPYLMLDPGTTKNDEPRTVPLAGELCETLRLQFQMRDRNCPLVFSRDGKRIVTIRKTWIRACVKAGLGTAKTDEKGRIKFEGYEGLRFHDLRRSGVRNLVRAGVPESVAMAISGHKTRAIFERYNITSGRDLNEAAKKLDAYIAEQHRANGANSGQIVVSASKAKTTEAALVN